MEDEEHDDSDDEDDGEAAVLPLLVHPVPLGRRLTSWGFSLLFFLIHLYSHFRTLYN